MGRDVQAFDRAHERLVQRRAKLVAELRDIDAKLGTVSSSGRPKGVLAHDSSTSKILAFVTEHPGCAWRDIHEGCSMNKSVVSTALLQLTRNEQITRRMDGHARASSRAVWRYWKVESKGTQ